MIYKIIAILLLTPAFASASVRNSSFVLECENTQSLFHLMPLTFFEFRDEVKISDLSPKIIANVKRTGPLTYKNIDSYFKNVKLTPQALHYLDDDSVEPILPIPGSCRIATMVLKSSKKDYLVNRKLWDQASPNLQLYFLLETVLFDFIKKDLAPVDYRRFALYTSLAVFENFSLEEKIFFLAHYDLNELVFSGISLDLSKEYELYYDNKSFKSAWPFEESTFEGSRIESLTTVNFHSDGKVKNISPLTPWRKNIKGQEFSFISHNPKRERWKAALHSMSFHPNGNVHCSLAVPFKNLYNVLSDIDPGIFPPKDLTFTLCFYPNQQIRLYSGKPGKLQVAGQTVRATKVEWYENGKIRIAHFEPTVLEYKGKRIKASAVDYDQSGNILYLY